MEGHSSSVRFVAFSPDGKRVASVSMDMLVKIWDAATGAEVNLCVALHHSNPSFHLLLQRKKHVFGEDLAFDFIVHFMHAR